MKKVRSNTFTEDLDEGKDRSVKQLLLNSFLKMEELEVLEKAQTI